MPEVKFTKENLLERTQLSPGWRLLKVKEMEEGPGKSDPTSTVWSYIFIVHAGPEVGVPIRHWFSEKAMGRLVDFVKCFTGGKVEEGKSYDLNSTVNRLVEGYVQYDLQQGFNVIKDFRPAPASAQVSKGA
jgi:hypothetical protein